MVGTARAKEDVLEPPEQTGRGVAKNSVAEELVAIKTVSEKLASGTTALMDRLGEISLEVQSVLNGIELDTEWSPKGVSEGFPSRRERVDAGEEMSMARASQRLVDRRCRTRIRRSIRGALHEEVTVPDEEEPNQSFAGNGIGGGRCGGD